MIKIFKWKALTMKGFTLIELMIVIAIIGVLASIGIPSYLTYVKNAQIKACLAETKSYANDTYYLLYDQTPETHPQKPIYHSCSNITDASSWNELTTSLMIEAKSKNSTAVDIRCDLSKGANCTIIP